MFIAWAAELVNGEAFAAESARRRRGPPPVRHTIWGPKGYVVPKPNGFVFVGATMEEVGYRKGTTARGLASLRRMANDLVPPLSYGTQVDAWAALRPGSPDSFPILGAVPGWEGLWVASGHFRNGILLSPVTGQLMARSLLAGKEAEGLTPFSPSRFAGVCADRGRRQTLPGPF